MAKEREDWVQSIYQAPMLDGMGFAAFIDNFAFCMKGKIVCIDLVEGPILNELLIDEGYPFFKPYNFLRLLRKPVAVEWMDVYVSGSSLIISRESDYEETLSQADILIRAVDGGYIYTYAPCMSGGSKVSPVNFSAIEVIRAPLSELSFPG